MKSPVTRRHLFWLALLILAASSLSARDAGATFDAQTANGQTTFHVGERIQLKLTFTSPNDTQYVVAPWGPSRVREFDLEKFEISPSTGWSDPLTTYFAQYYGESGNLWSWSPLLKSKPLTLLLDLNQWVRFDQPGNYRVRVISQYVSEAKGSSLQSNVFELHILEATPEWQEATFTAIHARLDEDSIATLRYLGTRAAIDEMTGNLRESSFVAEECGKGLVGLPGSMRDVAIASMNRRIDEADFPISVLFFRTMSLLFVTPGSNKESVHEQLKSLDRVLWQAVLSAIPKKEPLARAESVQTLLFFGSSINSPGIKLQMGSLLSASLLYLDRRSQVDDLRQHWDLLRSPAIVPALQILAKRSPANDGTYVLYSAQDLESAALRRWYELDPAGARNEILTQIGSATPSLSARALAFLPAEPLAQFESVWAEAFVRTTNQLQENALGSLLVKFGTGAAASQMIARLNEPPRYYSYMARALALAYLVRFSPDEARPLLKHEIAKNEAGSSHYLLRLISESATDPVLNEVAIEALSDSDSRTVIDALQYLRSYGRKSDEKPIWDRYVKWTQEWAGKADILDDPTPGMHPCGEVCTGEEIARTLIANQGWLADQALISRILQRCIGKHMCKTLEDYARSAAAAPYMVTLPNTADPLGEGVLPPFSVAQYAPMSLDLLEAKLSQYPPGTKFTLNRLRPATEEQSKFEDQVQAIFEKNHTLLERPTAFWP